MTSPPIAPGHAAIAICGPATSAGPSLGKDKGSPAMDNDEEEACTPRADETTPLQEKPKSRRRLALGAACATLALGAAATATGRQTVSALFGWSATWGNDYQCRVGGWIELSEVHDHDVVARTRRGSSRCACLGLRTS